MNLRRQLPLLLLLCGLTGCAQEELSWLFAVQSKNASVVGEELTLEGVGRTMVTYRQDRPGWTASIPWVSLANGWRQVEGPLEGKPLEAHLSGSVGDDIEASVKLQILGPPTVDAAGSQLRWQVKVLGVETGKPSAVDEETVLRSITRGRLEPTYGSWDELIEAAAEDARLAN